MGGTSAEDLKHVRITRVDESMPMGGWLRAHGLPCQGLYVDSGIEAGHPRSEGDGKHSNDAIVPASVAKSPTTRALLLRDGSQEPIDDLEYDYLVHLAHDFELIYEGESQKREERHIAQTLQIGMRNSTGGMFRVSQPIRCTCRPRIRRWSEAISIRSFVFPTTAPS